jgi:formate dehydrogenase
MAKVLCVLYPDPVTGYPPNYTRLRIPAIESYPNGQLAPNPTHPDAQPGRLVGCVSGELGLREYLEEAGHELIVTSDQNGPDSVFEKHLPDAEVVISQPVWPAYLTAERLAKATKLKLAITAGIGSDHVDLKAATERGVTVAEVTYSNSISVAEHVVMLVLSLVRNYVPAHQYATNGGWNIADCVSRSYDVEGMHFATIGAGRIGLAALRRLQPFDVHLHYTDIHRLPLDVERELDVTYHRRAEDMIIHADVLNLQMPLYPSTRRYIDEKKLKLLKRGAYLINTAHAELVDREAVGRALESGRLAGYAGDVWYPQPAPVDHPWRRMPHNGMTPHMAGTSLSAQARYAAGTLEILECFYGDKPIRPEYLVVQDGSLAGVGAHSYRLN